MNVDFSPDVKALVQQAIESGRLNRAEDAVQEALSLWAERERQKTDRRTDDSTSGALEKARAFEVWARSHPHTPPLSDEAIRRENLIRDAR
jgi:Arc/MetJ-type ribon-helix-helix transcriptional regulator